MRRRRDAVAAAAALAVCFAQAAAAQPADPQAARLELAATISRAAPSALGSAAADLTASGGGTGLALFQASAELGAAAAAEVRLGWRLRRALTLSAVGGYARPGVEVRVTGDAEGAPDVRFDGTTLRQWTAGARVDVGLRGLELGSGRVTPFVMAAGGWLRHVPDGGAAGLGGRFVEGGAGVAWAWRGFRASRRLAQVALVAEARVRRVTGGYNWGRDGRTSAVFGVGLSTRWGAARKRGIMGPSSARRP